MTDRPVQVGMTSDQAAETGQAMLTAARAQRDQIAQGFHAERQAVLDEVARRQAGMPAPDPNTGPVPTPPQQSQAQPQGQGRTYTQAEIEAALRAMNMPQPAQQPGRQPAQPQARPAGSPRDLVMEEIVRTIRAMIAVQVRAELAALGLVPAAAAEAKKSPPAAQNSGHNAAASPSG